MKITALVVLMFLQDPGAVDFTKFLTGFKKAAEAKDEKALKKYIYDWSEVDKEMTADLIEVILEDNELATGDGAISNRAIAALADEVEHIVPIPGELFKELSQSPFLSRTTDVRADNTYILDYKDAHLILVSTKKGLRLLFWENLNNLLN